MKKSEQIKRFKNGSYSTVLTVIVIAVLLVVNFIIAGLPTTITKPDFSEQQMLTLSLQTEELVKGLQEEVTIYMVTQEGSEDNITLELVEKYASLSSKIKVEVIDSALYPTFAAQYTTGGLTDNSLVVESAKRYKVIAQEDIYAASYTYDESYNTVQSTDFDGENQLTNAIDFVTSDTLPVAYTVTGHSESPIPDDLVAEITSQNIEIKDLNLIQTNAIPQDCGALIFYAPQKDITEAEAKLVKEYYENGGGLFIVTMWGVEETPNLNGLLETYGLSVADGLALEGDTNYMYPDNPIAVYAQIESHTITDPLLESSMNVLVQMAQPINFATDDMSLKGTTLLTTSNKGYIKDSDALLEGEGVLEKEDGDETGTLTLGMAVEKQVDENTTGKLVYYSTPMLFDATVNAYSAGGNYDMVINSFGWMCDHESAISIHSKSLDGTQLQVSSAQANLWSTIAVAIIPVALIIVGIVIWIVRRRK